MFYFIMFNYLYFYVILMFYFWQQTHSVKYTIKIKGYNDVQSDNPYLTYKELKLTKVNKTHMSFNGRVEIHRDDIPADRLKINIKGYQKFSNGWQVSPLLYLENRLLCELIKTEKMVIPDIIASSNYTEEPCPGAKGIYSITNYMPDPEKLPENIPGDQWRVSVDMMDNDRILSTIHTYFNLVRNL